MRTLNDFTGLYSLSKTLRFELKPIGKTLENIQKSGILERDSHRAESYIKVKAIIDRYHKAFIERVLGGLTLKTEDKGEKNSLSEFYLYYVIRNKDKSQKAVFLKIQDGLRKQIAKNFSNDEVFKILNKKELIKVELCDFVKTEEERALIDEFKNFTTYFTGFHENRKNMYSDKAQSTAIAYRLIHENLPKFIDNIAVFDQMNTTSVSDHLPLLYSQMEEYLNVTQIAEMFKLNYFNIVLTQSQIDVYNAIIGGKTFEDGTKIQGLNEYINRYNQQQTEKENRLPKFKPLYKQILSDRNAISWLPDEFETDQQLLDSIKMCMSSLDEFMINTKGGIGNSLMHLLTNLSDYSLDGIYLKNDLQLTDISQKMFGNWGIIQKAIEQEYLNRHPQTKREKADDLEKRIKEYIKGIDSISIQELNRCLLMLGAPYAKQVEVYFAQLGAINTEEKQQENHFACILNAYTELKELLDNPYSKEKKLSQDAESVHKIKNLLDKIKSLEHFVKPLLGTGEEAGKDERFYGEFISLWERLNEIAQLYDKVRNYMTKKPYSTAKIKLNFESKNNFLGGWVDSQTDKSNNGTQYGGYLFRKLNSLGEYDYFLGVSASPTLFRNKKHSFGSYERLNYYQLKSTSIYGNSYIGKNSYSKDKHLLLEVIESFVNQIDNIKISDLIKDEILNEKSKLSNDKNGITPSKELSIIKSISVEYYEKLLQYPTFSELNSIVVNNLHKTICSLVRVPKAKQYTDNKFSLFTEAQEVIEDLCQEKVFNYFYIADDDMENAMNDESKRLFLFQITNKDLSFSNSFLKGSRKSRGVDNLHTMYFKALMEGGQNIFDIGVGEIFYRESTRGLKKDPTHLKNVPIDNKNDFIKKDKPKSIFSYDLVKNRRYTIDKFLLHLSITQNYQSDKYLDLNQMTNEYIQKADDLHIIGLDRGERHLLYLSVINMKGEIKEQYSLNEIVNEYNGKVYTTNYHDLLDKREEERKIARQSWQTINSIKELKEGYLSQVVQKIAQLMVKYNAIVVLEDLNFGFMKGRQKVEKQIYQKFEKMLIDKLNYLVDKKKEAAEPGGLLRAYQLTNKFESFQKLGKQSGFLYYVPAWNTSKMDPVTGFVNLFTSSDLHYESVIKSKAFFCKFDIIRYNSDKGWFEFILDYSRFTTRADGTREHWTLCSQGTRIETFRDESKNMQWNSEEIQLTQEFKNLFEKYDVDINGNLKEAIVNQEDKAFFYNDSKNSKDKQKGLFQLFKLMLQMRNSVTGKDTDYLISPVADEDGCFFDSRNCADNLPKNADANGAYNIARKGLWVIRQIKDSTNLQKLSLAISNKEWLQFTQDKPYVDKK